MSPLWFYCMRCAHAHLLRGSFGNLNLDNTIFVHRNALFAGSLSVVNAICQCRGTPLVHRWIGAHGLHGDVHEHPSITLHGAPPISMAGPLDLNGFQDCHELSRNSEFYGEIQCSSMAIPAAIPLGYFLWKLSKYGYPMNSILWSITVPYLGSFCK